MSQIISKEPGVQDWLSLVGNKSTREVRMATLKHLARANGFTSAEIIPGLLRREEANPYELVNRMITLLKKEEFGWSTIGQYRDKAAQLIDFINPPNYRKEYFKKYVPKIKSAPSIRSRKLTHEEKKALIHWAKDNEPFLLVYLEIEYCAGNRVSEAFKLEVKDLILSQEQEHELERFICGRIEWPAFTEQGEAANKTLNEHFSFLSKEAVQVIQEHIKRYRLKPEDLLLPVDVKSPRMWAYNKIMKALRSLNLTERSGYLDRYTVHPHSFRSMKTSTEKRLGYTEEYAESTTGHSTGTRKAYEELEEMAEEWMLKVEPTLRFLE